MKLREEIEEKRSDETCRAAELLEKGKLRF